MVAVVICCIRIQLNGYQFIYSNSIPFLWLAAKFQTQFAYSTCKSNIPLADLPNKISVLIGNSLCKYSVKLLFNFLFGLFGTWHASAFRDLLRHWFTNFCFRWRKNGICLNLLWKICSIYNSYVFSGSKTDAKLSSGRTNLKQTIQNFWKFN